jgi:hypothetical protein
VELLVCQEVVVVQVQVVRQELVELQVLVVRQLAMVGIGVHH